MADRAPGYPDGWLVTSSNQKTHVWTWQQALWGPSVEKVEKPLGRSSQELPVGRKA